MKHKKNKLKQFIWRIAGAVFLLIFFIYKIWQPQFTHLENAKNSYGEAQNQYARSLQLVKSIPQLGKTRQQLQNSLTELKKYTAENDYISGFLKQIVTISEDSAIDIISIRPDNKIIRKDFIILPIETYVTGTQQNLCKFLNDIETRSSFIRIERIEIKGKQETLPTLSAFLRINTYIIN